VKHPVYIFESPWAVLTVKHFFIQLLHLFFSEKSSDKMANLTTSLLMKTHEAKQTVTATQNGLLDNIFADFAGEKVRQTLAHLHLSKHQPHFVGESIWSKLTSLQDYQLLSGFHGAGALHPCILIII